MDELIIAVPVTTFGWIGIVGFGRLAVVSAAVAYRGAHNSSNTEVREPRTGLPLSTSSGLHRRVGTELGQDLFEGGDELLQLVAWDVAEQGGGPLLSLGVPGRRHGGTLLRQAHQGGAPVGGMRSAPNEAGRLKRVDQSGHVAGRALQHLTELALGHRTRLVQPPDQLGARRSQAVRTQPTRHRLAKDHRHLEQLVHRAPRQLGRRRTPTTNSGTRIIV